MKAPESSLSAYVHTKSSTGARKTPEHSLFAYAHAKSSNGARCWILGLISFGYFYTNCARIVKAMARLCGCSVAPEPSLFAYAHAKTSSGARYRNLGLN